MRMVDFTEGIEASMDPGNINSRFGPISLQSNFYLSYTHLVIAQISCTFLPSRRCGNGNNTFQIAYFYGTMCQKLLRAEISLPLRNSSDLRAEPEIFKSKGFCYFPVIEFCSEFAP